MEIALTPDLEDLVRDEVESGRYSSPGDVIRQALRLFRQPATEEPDVLRREIRKGLDDLASGAFNDFDGDSLPQMVDEIRARGLAKLKADQG